MAGPLGAAGAGAADAQEIVASERVVAVVGDEVILLSELEEQAVIAASELGVDVADPAAVARLRREILDQMVADLVVVAAASADDSVQVSETQVNEGLEAELAQIRSRFPSPSEFEREIARSQWRTLENYRKNLRRIKRRELLAQAYLSRHAPEAEVSAVGDADVRAYWEQNRERFGTRPATVTIEQLDVVVRPADTALERARALADSLIAEIRSGASFTELARQFSADSATARRGGDLGYFGRGTMVASFEEAAFGIDSVGRIAGPVESPFGVHVIRLEDRQGDEIKARHILIAADVTEADRAAARALGQALVDSLAAGADFDSLRVRYGTLTRGELEPVEGPLNQLPQEWQSALRELPVGGTTGLLRTPQGFTIVRLAGRGGGEPYTFEELEPRLRTQLEQTRGQQAFVEKLKQQVHVEVRLPQAAAGAPAAEAQGPLSPAPAVGEIGGPAPVDVPAVEGGPTVATPEDAYVPGDPSEEPVAPQRALEGPPPVADTPLPDRVPAELPPGDVEDAPPGGVDPAGAVDSTSSPAPSAPRP
ncbi:MAG: peptidylprolyl isomerase [Gemmatimonadota bacterium]